jgi:hypothetical protein
VSKKYPDIVYTVTASAPRPKAAPAKPAPPGRTVLKPPAPPTGKRPKVLHLPEPVEKLNRASRRALLRVEARALYSMRDLVRRITLDLARDLSGLKGTPDLRRARALGAIRRTSTQIASAVEGHVLQARHLARDASADRLKPQLDALKKALLSAGVSPHRLPKIPLRAQATEDAAFAHMVGQSYGAAWSQAAISKTFEWQKRPELSLSAAIERTAAATDPRLRRIATSEVRSAFNSEHRAEAESLLEPGAEWRRYAFRRWDATLERTCQDCQKHHGEIVPLGQPFFGGDEPSLMHPNCRCIDTIFFFPMPSKAA